MTRSKSPSILSLSFVFLALTSASYSAFAAESLVDRITACTNEKDSLKRLICFDKVAAFAKKEASYYTGTPSQQQSSNTAKEAPAVNNKKQQTVAAIPAKPVTTATQKQPEDIFGKEIQEAVDAIESVTYTIKSATKNVYKKWRFTFENGQQWIQKDTNRNSKFAAGDTVIIKRGLLNAFYLHRKDNNISIRVKRVD